MVFGPNWCAGVWRMCSVTSLMSKREPGPWRLPEPRPLGGDAFFENPDWRYDLHEARGLVREARGAYKSSPGKKRPS